MSLYVSDDYIDEMGEYIKKNYIELQLCYNKYLGYLKDVIETGIKENELHDALVEFRNQVKSCGENDICLSDMGTIYERELKRYISDLKDADRYLYGD